MSTFSEKLLNTSIQLIEKYGNTLTLKKADSQTYDPSQGKVITVEGASVDFKGTYENYKSEEIQGLIQVGDIRSTIYYDTDVLPEIDKDKIVADGIQYNIKNVAITGKGQDQTIILELQLRR